MESIAKCQMFILLMLFYWLIIDSSRLLYGAILLGAPSVHTLLQNLTWKLEDPQQYPGSSWSLLSILWLRRFSALGRSYYKSYTSIDLKVSPFWETQTANGGLVMHPAKT